MKHVSHWAATPQMVWTMQNLDTLHWRKEWVWRRSFSGANKIIAPVPYITRIRSNGDLITFNVVSTLQTLVKRKWIIYPPKVYRFKWHESKPCLTPLGSLALDQALDKTGREH